MPSKYATTSNVRYDEKKWIMTSKVHHSERASAISDRLLSITNVMIILMSSLKLYGNLTNNVTHRTEQNSDLLK